MVKRGLTMGINSSILLLYNICEELPSLVDLYRLTEQNHGFTDTESNPQIITAQWEGMGDVGSARYEPALLLPCPTIRLLSYSNCQRSIHFISKRIFPWQLLSNMGDLQTYWAKFQSIAMIKEPTQIPCMNTSVSFSIIFLINLRHSIYQYLYSPRSISQKWVCRGLYASFNSLLYECITAAIIPQYPFHMIFIESSKSTFVMNCNCMGFMWVLMAFQMKKRFYCGLLFKCKFYSVVKLLTGLLIKAVLHHGYKWKIRFYGLELRLG